MSTPLIFLAGAGVGLGVIVVAVSLRRPRPALADALARMATPTAVITDGGDSGQRGRLVVSLARAFGFDRLITTGVRSDLRALGRSPDDHIARSLLTALGLGALPPVMTALAAIEGVGVSVTVPGAVTFLCFAAGAVLPTVGLHQQAEKQRRSFKHALGAYLNLVAVNVAAGRGVEGALDTAAAAGQGPAFVSIRQALYRAKVTGQTPWAGLDRLGEELGIDELRELAATVSLAGGVGAKVRESLAAKARTLRQRGLADIQAAANAANERMAIPVILLVVGLIVFVGYPAVDRILTGL